MPPNCVCTSEHLRHTKRGEENEVGPGIVVLRGALRLALGIARGERAASECNKIVRKIGTKSGPLRRPEAAAVGGPLRRPEAAAGVQN